MSDVLSTIEDCERWLRKHDSPGDDAYDGSHAAQRRELTARERDVLCRILHRHLRELEAQPDESEVEGLGLIADRQRRLDIVRLYVVLEVIDPRRDEEDECED